MKFFVDSTNVDEIQEIVRWGCLSGATTTPTLVAGGSTGNFERLVSGICRLVDGPVIAELVSETADRMVAEAAGLSSWHPNVVIELPMSPEGLAAAHLLRDRQIKTNVTQVFSATQALLAAAAGASYVSVFMGRLDDMGINPCAVLEEAIKACVDQPVQIIAASICHPLHVTQAASVGAHIAAVPPKVLRLMLQHSLTDKAIAMFEADWAGALAV